MGGAYSRDASYRRAKAPQHDGGRCHGTCGVDDHLDRGRVRLAPDGARLPAQQPADRLLVPAARERRQGHGAAGRCDRRQPRAAGQAAALVDGADADLRSDQQPAGSHAGLAGRQPDHQLRRQDRGRRARLAARHPAGHCTAELRQPQRADRGRGRSGVGRRDRRAQGTRSRRARDPDDERPAGHRASARWQRCDPLGRRRDPRREGIALGD